MAGRAGRSRRFRQALAAAVILVIGAAGVAVGAGADPGGVPAAPAKGKGVGRGPDAPTPRSDPLPGQYIVTLQPDVNADDFAAQERGRGNQVDHVYGHALNGYSGAMSPGEVARLSADPRVARVEQDSTVHALDTESNATWGLDRLDQRQLPLDTTYTYPTTASGVTA